MTSRFRPVVAGVDGSPASMTVLDQAVAAAHRRLLPLRVVRTVPDAGAGVASAARELADVRTTVTRTLPAAMVDVAVRPGPREAVLTDESRTAALLVLAASAGTPASPGGLGPTAAALLRSAACPVLLARSPRDGAGVVVGVDGSPQALDVLDAAVLEACVRSTTLTVVSCGARPAERRRTEHHVAGIRTGHPSIPVELRAGGVDLAGALVAASHDAALVVVGRGLDPAAQSSEAAAAVAGRATCPVLVVPCAGSPGHQERAAARRSAVALTRPAGPDDPGHRRVPRREGRRR